MAIPGAVPLPAQTPQLTRRHVPQGQIDLGASVGGPGVMMPPDAKVKGPGSAMGTPFTDAPFQSAAPRGQAMGGGGGLLAALMARDPRFAMRGRGVGGIPGAMGGGMGGERGGLLAALMSGMGGR